MFGIGTKRGNNTTVPSHALNSHTAVTLSQLSAIISDAVLVGVSTVQTLINKIIQYNPSPETDLTYSGETGSYTAGTDVAWGNICMLQSDGKYDPACADAEANASGKLVFATETLVDDGSGIFIKKGYIRDDSWSWNVGGKIYLLDNPASKGSMTQTAPSDTGDIVRILGYAESATVICFDPDKTYVEV